jgi:glutamyl-tRNA synthetase
MIRTRFAPSPTGFLHSGNYRTAVFAYLFAKQNNGAFVLRIEDTDRARSKQEYEDNIIESLKWLDLPWDEFARQSENAPKHRALLEQLIAEDKAYISKETPKEEGGRTEVIRFRNPGGQVAFKDLIRGEISMDVSDLGDFVLAKSLDEPVFHFAVVADDRDMNITHIVRGEDHISNTPRQVLLWRALGAEPPAYAHLPLVLAEDRTKLSKRKGAKALTEYRDSGILPEAMLNYLSFIGWNPGDEREYLSRDELVKAFSFDRVQTSPAIFDETKLKSVNQHWMRTLSDEDFITRGELQASNPEILRKAVSLMKDRSQTFGEAREMLHGELQCLFEQPTIDRTILIKKETPERVGATADYLKDVEELVAAMPPDPAMEDAKIRLMAYADAEEAKGKGGRGAVLWPLRYALSGQERSPDPFTLISILGREESRSRITAALAAL